MHGLQDPFSPLIQGAGPQGHDAARNRHTEAEKAVIPLPREFFSPSP